ncbi:MAG: hypothetical protein HRT53_03375 [Colwellia sp.]|nr:hypothetical protein [Colwellia sp.]
MKIINTLLKQAKNILLVLSIALFSMSSYAGNTLVSVLISGNDCDGDSPFAGQGFADCTINIEGTELAFVLTKFGYDDGTPEGHEEGDHYTYLEEHWDIEENDSEYKSGTWTTPTGAGYPEVSFWSAKAGNSGLNLFWYVTDADYATECDPKLTLSCMSAAVSVTTGTWSTPYNNANSQAALSHLTFFGGVCLQDCGPNTEVPEPSTIVIFAFALGLLRIQSKHRNR